MRPRAFFAHLDSAMADRPLPDARTALKSRTPRMARLGAPSPTGLDPRQICQLQAIPVRHPVTREHRLQPGDPVACYGRNVHPKFFS